MAENLPFENDESQTMEENISRLLSKKFTVSRKGYSVDEVREFIFDVEIYFRKMLRRETDFRIKLAEAVKRSEVPELSEETLSRAIGMESGKVLRAAHEAAKDIMAQSQSKADEILKEASAVMEETSAKAREMAGRIDEEAKLAAEAELQETRERCMSMLEEAKASRRKILDDLLERRTSLSHQVRQLRAAVDTFRTIFDNAEKAVKEVNESLTNAEESVNRAGDSVAEESAPGFGDLFPAESAYGYSPEEDDGSRKDRETGNITDIFSVRENRIETSAEADESGFEVLIGDGTEDAADTPEGYIESNGINDFISYYTAETLSDTTEDARADDGATTGHLSYGYWNDTEEESGFRILGSAEISMPPKPAAAAENGDETSEDAEDLYVVATDHADDGARQEEEPVAMPEVGAVFIQSKSNVFAGEDVDQTGNADKDHTFDAVFGNNAEKSDTVTGVNAPFVIGSNNTNVQTSVAEIPGDGALTGIVFAGGDDDNGADSFRPHKGDIDTIFAQIRASRDREVRQAISVLGGNAAHLTHSEPDSSVGNGGGANDNIFAETGAYSPASPTALSVSDFVYGESGGNDSGAGSVAVGDKAPGDATEDMPGFLAKYVEDLLKKTKKLIRQHQNLVLDDLRLTWDKGSYDYAKTSYIDLCERDMEEVNSYLAELYSGARTFAATGACSVCDQVFPDASVDFYKEANALISHVLEPVTAILKDGLYQNGNSLQDEQDFMEHLSSVYRELKGDRLERSVGDCVVKISSGGIYDEAIKEGSRLKWIMDGEVCPDCEDNSLLITPAGKQFPTGHLIPPAHPGCRCAVKVVDQTLD